MSINPRNIDEENLLNACKNEDINVLLFVENVILFTRKNRLKLRVVTSSHIDYDDGTRGNGYFSSDKRTLGVAVGKDVCEWLPILLHERCHAQQFVDDANWFQNLENSCNDFFDWLVDKKDLTKLQVENHAKNIMLLESDCEQRSVSSISYFGLEHLIDITTYAQKANSYVTFYKFIVENKAWYSPGKEPYNIEEIWKRFPDSVVLNGCEYTSELSELYKKCL